MTFTCFVFLMKIELCELLSRYCHASPLKPVNSSSFYLWERAHACEAEASAGTVLSNKIFYFMHNETRTWNQKNPTKTNTWNINAYNKTELNHEHKPDNDNET